MFKFFIMNMERFIYIWTIFLCVSSVQSVDPFYTITAPEILRPNSPYQVVVTVLNVAEPVNLEVSLKPLVVTNLSESEILKTVATVNNEETKKLELQIGNWDYLSYELNVKGNGGVNFNNLEIIGLKTNAKAFSIFIQTDKGIYQPGQTVHFRVIATKPIFLPFNPEGVSIHVNDPQRNRIKQWANVTFSHGVYSGEFQLSDQVNLGDWSIHVIYQTHTHGIASITVAEYTLPKFEVNIHLPTFVTWNESDVTAFVQAKYTYGKPVKGYLTLNVSDYYCSWPCTSSSAKPLSLNTSIDGKAEFNINLVKDMALPSWYKYGRKLKFSATVTDSLTGRQMTATNELQLFDSKHKIHFEKPSHFKPGLLFTTFVNLVLQDDSPVIDEVNKVKVTYSFSRNEKENEQLYSVPKNGKIKVEIIPPESASTIEIRAQYLDVSAYASIDKSASLSKRYIHIVSLTKNLKIGEEVELLVKSTEPLEYPLILEAIGRGDILYLDIIPGSKSKEQTVLFKLTQEMAPEIRVIIYYLTSCGEVVGDGLDLGVGGVFRTPVILNINPESAKPGTSMEVSVKTNPNAFVALSAVDQSVLLLKKGNDLTASQLLTDLRNYELGRGFTSYFDYQTSSSYILPPQHLFVFSVIELFQTAGLLFITNGLTIPNFKRYSYLPMLHQYPIGAPGAPASDRNYLRGGIRETPQVRSYFPETFLWTNATASNDGTLNIKTKVPDTITSYFINAFAVDDENGIGLLDQPAKVQIFRPFFVTLNLPYSVIRGETLALQALVFNYLNEDVEAVVTLNNEHQEFTFIDLENEISKDETSTLKEISKNVKIKSGDGVSVLFYIIPKKIGYIDLKVTAISNVAGDAIIKKLLVKAEGIPTYVNKAIVVDLREQSQFEEKVHINIPKNVVEDSERIEISAINDIMGTTVNNLDKLLRMPYGCGEQNMLNFVPNIAITDYLSSINQLTPSIKDKAIRFMESGYQRQLTYKRFDNSFSTFGNSDSSGSTWLTAFVVKSFIQAKRYITVDDEVIESSLKWLSHLKTENGSYPEVGTVFNKAMQGGSSQDLGLTAYVLSALLEGKENGFHPVGNISDILAKLESGLDFIETDYDLVFVTYVLHLANSPLKDVAFNKMNEHSKTVGDTKFWTMPLPEVNQTDPFAYYDRPRSVDVEMTSYALLTYSIRNMIAEGLPIMKWLLTKRNANGGFESTQDTVVGIQALTQYAKQISGGADSSVHVKFAYQGGEKELTLTRENALILHREKIADNVREIDISATGKGISILQVSWSYNMLSVHLYPAFAVSVHTSDGYLQLTVEACAKYIYEGESNMAIMEIGFPSGYVADKELLPAIDSKLIRRVETKNGDSVVVIYFDKIGKEVCVNATAYRNNQVMNLKPVLVEVYDYYEPDKHGSLFYDPPITSVCDVCETDECRETCDNL